MSFIGPAYGRNAATVPEDLPSDCNTQFKTRRVGLIKDISSPWSHLHPSTARAAIMLFLPQPGSKSVGGHRASRLLRGTWGAQIVLCQGGQAQEVKMGAVCTAGTPGGWQGAHAHGGRQDKGVWSL